MRILYVEDNTTNVILVQRVANMGKHTVINYDNGQDALDNFIQDAPELILMDVQLRGELNGLDVVRKIRAMGSTLPIIAVTAYAMKGDRQRCLDAGCDEYIPKPISVTELVSVFRRYNEALGKIKRVTAAVPAASPTTPPPLSPSSSVHEAAGSSAAEKPDMPEVDIPVAAAVLSEAAIRPAVSDPEPMPAVSEPQSVPVADDKSAPSSVETVSTPNPSSLVDTSPVSASAQP